MPGSYPVASLGTDTAGPGEAVFAIRFSGKPQMLMKN